MQLPVSDESVKLIKDGVFDVIGHTRKTCPHAAH